MMLKKKKEHKSTERRLKGILRQQVNGESKPKDFFYANAEEYVAVKGKLYKSNQLTGRERDYVYQTWIEMFEKYGPIDQRHRFAACQRIMSCDKGERLRYVEGFLFNDHLLDFVIFHAWLTINNKVLDLSRRRDYPFICVDMADMGKTFSLENIKDEIAKPIEPMEESSNFIIGEIPANFHYLGVELSTVAMFIGGIYHRSNAIGSVIQNYEQEFPLLRGRGFEPEDVVQETELFRYISTKYSMGNS